MAINPSAKYANIDTTDPAYPLGKARNVVVKDDGTGTPFDKDWLNDLFGFQQALLAEAGISATGTPDTATASQYLDAIQAIIASGVSGVQSYSDLDALKAAEIDAGKLGVAVRYYPSGDVVQGLVYLCLTPAQYGGVPDGYIDHYDAAGNVLKLVHNGVIDATQAGCVFDGSDVYAALQSACDNVNGVVTMPRGGATLSQKLFIRNNCTGLIGAGEIDTIITKDFDGDAVEIQNQGATISDFWVVGSGATRTGGGVYVVPDDVRITKMRVTDTLDSPVICKHNDSTYLVVDDCYLSATSPSVYAVRGTGVDLSTSPTVRTFRNLKGGAALVDFSGMNRAILSDSFGTLIKFDVDSSKITLSNNRLTSASADITIDGKDHIIDSNHFGFGSTSYNLIIAATATNVTYSQSNTIIAGSSTNRSVVDNSSKGAFGTTNSLSTKLETWTSSVEWKGSASDGVFGNSTYQAYYSRDGRYLHCTFSLIRGSTATNPVGDWAVTLPFKAFVQSVGTAKIKSSTGTYYTALAEVVGGSNQVKFYLNTGTGVVNDSSVSFGTGGELAFHIGFVIATS